MAAQRSNTPGGLEEQCDQRVGRAKQLDFTGKEYLGKGVSHGAPRHVHLEVLLCPNKCKRVRNRYLTLSFLFSTRPLCAFRELLKVRKEPPTKGKRKPRWSSQQVEALPVLSSQSETPHNSWIWTEVHMEDFCQDRPYSEP